MLCEIRPRGLECPLFRFASLRCCLLGSGSRLGRLAGWLSVLASSAQSSCLPGSARPAGSAGSGHPLPFLLARVSFQTPRCLSVFVISFSQALLLQMEPFEAIHRICYFVFMCLQWCVIECGCSVDDTPKYYMI